MSTFFWLLCIASRHPLNPYIPWKTLNCSRTKLKCVVLKITISQQWQFTGNVAQQTLIIIIECSGPNILNTTTQNTYILTRFILGGVVQQDWLRRQRQKGQTFRTECRIQGHIVGLLTPIYKKDKKFERKCEIQLDTLHCDENYLT